MNNTTAKPVVFLHIPKTAGSTLYRIIETHYRWETIYTMWQSGTLDDFKQLSPEKMAKIEMLRGHFAFGLHTHLPTTAAYFTILRDPIDRVASYYHFICRSPNHYCYQQVSQQNMSLEQFVTSQIDTLADNGQTRLLANLNSGHEIPFGQCTTDLLDEAKKNLCQHMQVVGLTERFDETLLLLKARFGWQKIYYSNQNVSANRQPLHTLPQSTLAALQACNQLDNELYLFAKTLFEEQLAQFGKGLHKQLATFRLQNGRWQPITHIQWALRKYPVRTYLRSLWKGKRP